jgi:hypothetical protein
MAYREIQVKLLVFLTPALDAGVRIAWEFQ